MSHSYLWKISAFNCRADQIPVVFSSNFSQLLVSSLNKEDAVLHPIAKKSMARIKAVFGQTKDSEVKAALAVVLQRQPGSALAQFARKSSEVVKVSFTSTIVIKKRDPFFSTKWTSWFLNESLDLCLSCLWARSVFLHNYTAKVNSLLGYYITDSFWLCLPCEPHWNQENANSGL